MSGADATNGWKRCSACKEPVDFGALYYVCSVSTCNRKRTALRFCSVSCWEVHLPTVRHRDAWAEERRAPSAQEAALETTGQAAVESATPGGSSEAGRPRRRIVPTTQPADPTAGSAPGDPPHEVLVIASRLRDYIRAVSGMNTSERVLNPLSEIVRQVAHQAIENARAEGRKTVLDRDVPDR